LYTVKIKLCKNCKSWLLKFCVNPMSKVIDLKDFGNFTLSKAVSEKCPTQDS
jgi:hypothetical protein